jgi:putative aldouronate transport system permease protein
MSTKFTFGKRKSMDNVVFDGVVNVLLIAVLVITIVPLWYVIIVSFTPLKLTQAQGFNLWIPPTEWSFEAYKQLLGSDSSFLRALLNSCIITGSGVAINMVLVSPLKSCRGAISSSH